MVSRKCVLCSDCKLAKLMLASWEVRKRSDWTLLRAHLFLPNGYGLKMFVDKLRLGTHEITVTNRFLLCFYCRSCSLITF